MKTTWRPSWEAEQRQPHFVTNITSVADLATTHGKQKFLWGNVPALDVLNLDANEGIHYKNDINILFAGTNPISPDQLN